VDAISAADTATNFTFKDAAPAADATAEGSSAVFSAVTVSEFAGDSILVTAEETF